MVWKKPKNKKFEGQGSNKLKSVPEEPKLKGCLKHRESSDQDSSQSSSRLQGGDSSIRDQSTKSAASRSGGSRSGGSRSGGSRSGESRGSGSSSVRWLVSVDQQSCNSAGSYVSSERGSRKSDHGPSSQNSDRSSPSVASHQETANNKRVRFNTVLIRDYERVVGDNPSCTSGPPIGIGWSYGKTRMIDVNTYEEARPYRKASSRLILPREEREALLLNWGASFHDIVEAVRGNIKIKNQRRQTVTNLGKVERIEEAFESATRTLKRALLLRRGNKVKRLQEQANLAQRALTSLKIAEDRALSEIRRNRAPTRVEPEKDTLEDYELNVAVASFGRSSPADAKVRRPRRVMTEESFSSSFESFTLGGNSTTPSQLEMERFYRELELEMFGDEELPSMVGQTLEVPSIQDDSDCRNLPSVMNVNLDDSFYSGIPTGFSVACDEYGFTNEIYQEDIDDALEAERNRSMISQSLLEDTDSEVANIDHPYDHGDQESLRYRNPLDQMYFLHGDFALSKYHSATSRLSSSLDSADPNRAQMTQSVVAMQYEFSQDQATPLHAGMSMLQDCVRRGGGQNEQPSFSEAKRLQFRRDSNGGPIVQHRPPPTHLSPSHWMEDQDSVNRFGGYETITISEDDFGDRDASEFPTESWKRHFVAPQQFPSSFY